MAWLTLKKSNNTGWFYIVHLQFGKKYNHVYIICRHSLIISYQKELCISREAAVTEMYERMKSEMKKMSSSLPAAGNLEFLCECSESVTGLFT